MDAKHLKNWLSVNNKADSWWLSIEGNTCEKPVSLSDAVKIKEHRPNRVIHIMHISSEKWEKIELSHRKQVNLNLLVATSIIASFIIGFAFLFNTNRLIDETQHYSEVLVDKIHDDNKTVKYKIETSIPTGSNIITCNVLFHVLPETYVEAKQIVKNALNDTISKYPGIKILATALDYETDMAIDGFRYGGPFVYDPEIGKIQNFWQESRGLPVFDYNRGNYLARVKKNETLRRKDSSHVRNWLGLYLIFPYNSPVSEIKKAAAYEVDRLKHLSMDIEITVFNGNISNPMTWEAKVYHGFRLRASYKTGDDSISFGSYWDWD